MQKQTPSTDADINSHTTYVQTGKKNICTLIELERRGKNNSGHKTFYELTIAPRDGGIVEV
jgi:hypothetical protein